VFHIYTAARDAFKAFDKKQENRIKVGDLEMAMKRLGHTIKPDWLEKVEHMIDSAGKYLSCIRVKTVSIYGDGAVVNVKVLQLGIAPLTENPTPEAFRYDTRCQEILQFCLHAHARVYPRTE